MYHVLLLLKPRFPALIPSIGILVSPIIEIDRNNVPSPPTENKKSTFWLNTSSSLK